MSTLVTTQGHRSYRSPFRHGAANDSLEQPQGNFRSTGEEECNILGSASGSYGGIVSGQITVI